MQARDAGGRCTIQDGKKQLNQTLEAAPLLPSQKQGANFIIPRKGSHLTLRLCLNVTSQYIANRAKHTVIKARRKTQSIGRLGVIQTNDKQSEARWTRCPACKYKTRTKVYENTVLINFSLLQELQVGNTSRCYTIQDDEKQLSQTLKAESLLPPSRRTQALFV